MRTASPFLRNLRFDIREAFTQDTDLESGMFEETSVSRPACFQCFRSVVEQVDITGDARRRHDLVQGDAPGDVALAGLDPVGREETADRALEVRESHRRISAARRKASRSP